MALRFMRFQTTEEMVTEAMEFYKNNPDAPAPFWERCQGDGAVAEGVADLPLPLHQSGWEFPQVKIETSDTPPVDSPPPGRKTTTTPFRDYSKPGAPAMGSMSITSDPDDPWGPADVEVVLDEPTTEPPPAEDSPQEGSNWRNRPPLL